MAERLQQSGESVSEQLRVLRERADLSMDKLAKLIGMKGSSSYQRYENPTLYRRQFLPFDLVKRLVPVLAGRGSPAITPSEVLSLAGVFVYDDGELEGVDFDTSISIAQSDVQRTLSELYPHRKPGLGEKRLPQADQADGPWPLNVPVVSTTMGGYRDADFEIDRDTVIGWVRRPARFRGIQIFAIYMQSNTMSPWREAGELLYVHPGRPGKPGDYVLVELLPLSKDLPPGGLVKRLVSLGDSTMTLAQYNPAREIQLPLDRVRAIHRVLDWGELLGS